MPAIALALGVFLLCSASARGQSKWRATTRRDTIYVAANSQIPIQAFNTPECVSTEFYFSGTFGIFPGKDSDEFDARYMFRDPDWAAPFPLANPPMWGGTNFNVYLQVSNNLSFTTADSLHVLEGYQPNHEYTAIYPGAGTYIEFQIYNPLNSPGNPYYNQATGGITIRSAQYTAGISIQHDTLAFPTTNVGLSSELLDSIAAYGLDPLEIDSVWIEGPQASNFSINSQWGTHFTLNSISTNQFTVSYTPTAPEITSTAWLIIRSPNAECPQRLDSILLTGYSAAPNGKIGPGTLDFGLVRTLTQDYRTAIAFDSGNAPYIITSCTIIPINGTDSGVFYTDATFPDTIYPNSNGQIQFTFKPDNAKPAEAYAYFWDSEGKMTKILLTGNGATPQVIASSTNLNFDTVFTGNTDTLFDTLTNIGNWTAHIIRTYLGCTNPNWFTFSPSDTSFYLDAGQSRIYTITFQPATTITTSLNACLNFYFDDASQPEVINLTGVEKQRTIKYGTNVIDFGRVKVGDDSLQTDSVENQSSRAAYFNYYFDTITNVFHLVGNDSTMFNVGLQDSLRLLFTPTVHGPASAWIHLVCTTGQTDSIFMFGFGAVAQPVFDPDTINFGTCIDLTQNYFQTTVTDTGDYPLNICSLDIVGPDSSEFSLVRPPTLPYTVPDSDRGSLTLGFNFTTNAHTGGIHHATLIIHYCDGSVDSLPMLGREATASVFINSLPINFGKVRVGHTQDTAVGFGNPEDIAEQIDTLRIDPLPPPAIPFSSKDSTASVPANGQSYYFDTVTFAPLARGIYTGWLFGGGGGMKDDSIMITGIGAQSEPLLSTHSMNLGKVTLLSTAGPMTFTLQDTGDWALAAQIIKINDPDSEFTVSLQSGATIDDVAEDSIAIGGISTYSVTFTPRFPELPDHKSELVFNYDDGTTDTVILIGEDESDFLAFDRDTIDFGLVRIGAPAPQVALGLLNTSSTTLTASKLTGPQNPFSVTPNANISVNSGDSAILQVSFAPQAIGPVQSVVSGQGVPFNASFRDSVVLEGIGAAPVPRLSVDTLNFDTVALGRVITRSFTLTNVGNWPLIISSAVSTINPAGMQDFTATVPADTAIDTSGTVTYNVTFTSTAPIQATPRIGYIVWTLDNGSTDTLVLIANDVPPLHVQIGFPHAYWGRPGDKIAAELDLQTAIPDTLAVDTLYGIITYDPTMVDLKEFGAADTSLK